MVTRSPEIADIKNHKREMNISKSTLLLSEHSVTRMQNRNTRKKKSLANTFLPYVEVGTSNSKRSSNEVMKHTIEGLFTAHKKIHRIIYCSKMNNNLENQRAYIIRCRDYDHTRVGQTKRTNVRKKWQQNTVWKEERTLSLVHHVRVTSHISDFDITKLITNMEHRKL